MIVADWVARWAGSARTWVVMAILAPVCMLAISGVMLLEMRRDAWDKAERTSQNLLQLIERDIARNVEMIDLSLQAVVDNLKAPGVAEAAPGLRQLILFDRIATASDIGALLALDENGDIVADAAGYPPRKVNYADREYFKAQRANPNLGLYISRPLVSRLTNAPVVVFSRRIDKPDGSFGGVALASLKLSYFHRLFDRLGIGPEGAINLYLRDGTRLMRYPHVAADIGANIAGSQNFDRFLETRNGSFVASSVRDGVERLYAFTQVGERPLVLNVAFATDDIEAEWRGRAIVIGAILLLLCALTAGLAALFGHELRRRGEMQSQLDRLSRTDVLTGLPNRRHFDSEFERAHDDALRRGAPLSLLIVDADHFKRINDRYGHAAGDEVLKGIAGRLSASVHRPGDVIARIGGEEFAVILPDTDDDGARRVAERIHAEMAGLAPASGVIGVGAITLSIGLAAIAAAGRRGREELYRLADAALYEAKSGGRNQTRSAPAEAAAKPATLRLVGQD